MTIPIVPGPFSFLQNIGQGIANYGEGKQKYKQQAYDRLQFLFKGIKEGDISPNVVKSPLFESLVKDSGIGDFNPSDITPAPTSQLRQAQGEEIRAALPGLSAAGRRQLAATGELPTASAEAKEGADTRAQSIRGTVLGQELSPEQQAAVAGVPSTTTAQAAAQGAQDPTLLESAYRVVTDLFRQTGRLPRPEEAFQYGSTQDLRAQAFGAQLNQPYYAAAIQRLADEQEKLKIAHEQAAARAAAAGLDVVAKNLTPQMQVIQDRIDARLADNKALESSLTSMARYGGQPTARDKQIMAQIDQNLAANANDNANLEAMRRQAAQVIAPRVSAQGGAPEGDIGARRNEWDRRKQAIEQNPNDPRVKGKTVEQLIGPRP